MRYLKFVVANYRAITGPLEIGVDRHSLIPIIGINESGKTTILHALYAFDHANDDSNNGRHLSDVANLYGTNPPPATVQAQIELTRDELHDVLDSLGEKEANAKPWIARIKRKRQLPTVVSISRRIDTKAYELTTEPLNSTWSSAVAWELIRFAPYILYFDDFRDKVSDKIEIPASRPETLPGWLAILEQLFKAAHRGLSIFQLAAMEPRQRSSVLARVQRHLNSTLTEEWAQFRLDDRDALEIALDFVQEPNPQGPPKSFVKMDIVETDAAGDRHYFYISDRSKGFFWFFNFVMKLEFNPKVIDDDDKNTVYLLDEPGSYLHASAQTKLCKKLKALSGRNRVIYCTHSHYLLNPEIIPISSIRIADKDGNGQVKLIPLVDYRGGLLERQSAFQPVIDALQIRPFILDLTARFVVLAEGMADYYALEMFRGAHQVTPLPCVGANSLRFYVGLMLAWQVPFRAVWDNDRDGRDAFSQATELFGDQVSQRHFRLLPMRAGGRKRILQDLFAGDDLRRFRTELELPANCSFDKVIAALYYSPLKTELLSRATQTRAEFATLFAVLDIANGG